MLLAALEPPSITPAHEEEFIGSTRGSRRGMQQRSNSSTRSSRRRRRPRVDEPRGRARRPRRARHRWREPRRRRRVWSRRQAPRGACSGRWLRNSVPAADSSVGSRSSSSRSTKSFPKPYSMPSRSVRWTSPRRGLRGPRRRRDQRGRSILERTETHEAIRPGPRRDHVLLSATR